MRPLHKRVSQVYYTYGLFCASHPIVTIVLVIVTVFITCYPLSNIPVLGNTLLHHRTPVVDFSFPQNTFLSNTDNTNDDIKKPRWYQSEPLAYVQQIVIKSVVSPWQPQHMVPSDAFRAPLSTVFPLLAHLNNFKLSNNSQEKSLGDMCFRVSEPVNARHLRGFLPDYSCLILSPANFWAQSADRFLKDPDFIKTVYKKYVQVVESPPTLKDLLFGLPWKSTGISRYYICNRQRIISYAITVILNKYDPSFISALRSDLESKYHDSTIKVNNSEIEDVVHVYFKEDNYFVEYIPLLLIYFVLLLYLYFSVRKIDMVKSKLGLAISAVITVIASLLMSVSICTLFGLTPTLNGGEIFPYLVVVIGVENVLVLTKSVVSTPVHLDVKIRVAQGLSKEGWSITKNLLSELLIMFVGFFTFNPAIQEFCAFALVGVLSDFYLQIAFFAPVLSVDIRRMELSDLQRQSVQQAVQEESAESFNIQPLFLCPFTSSQSSVRSPSSYSRGGLNSKLSQASLNELDQRSFMVDTGSKNRTRLRSAMPERPKNEMPRRVKFFYFIARFRIVQKLIMVCTLIWIGLILYKVGLVDKLTGENNLSTVQNTVPNANSKLQFPDTPEHPRPEEDGAWLPAGIWGEETTDLGPVEHTELESWTKLSIKHWPTLFHYYNTSLSGRYISILPSIHLSEIIDSETAKRMQHPGWDSSRLHSFDKKRDSYIGENDSHDVGDSNFRHYQKLNNFYPKSRREFFITICLCILSVIVITYFMVILYKCMCSRRYRPWRPPWRKTHRVRPRDKHMIKESVPLVLSGHSQNIECLRSDNGLIVSCCLGGQLKIWDCNTGDCSRTISRKGLTPPSYRKPCIGRNIDDSDADLYAEYHGGPRCQSYSEDLLMMPAGDASYTRRVNSMSESPSVRMRHSDNQQTHGDQFNEVLPDLTMAINTEFSSINSAGFQSTPKDGYDFKSWIEGAYGTQRAVSVSESSDAPNIPMSSSGSFENSFSPPGDRNRTWSYGDLSAFDTTADDESYQEPPSSVWCLDSQHGLIFTGCGNGRVEVWDCDTGELRFYYSINEIGITNLCVVSNRIIAARLDGSVDFIEIETFHSPLRVPPPPSSPQSMRKKATHCRSCSESKAQDIKMWDEVIRCSGVTTCRAHRQPINHLQCEGGRVVTASQDHTLKAHRAGAYPGFCGVKRNWRYKITSWTGHQFIAGFTPTLSKYSFTPESSEVFRFDNCLCLYTLHGHEGPVTALRLDKVAPYAAVSGSVDGTVRVWDLLTGSCVHKFDWHEATVVCVLTSPLYIVTLGLDERMCIWHRTKSTLLHTISSEQLGVGSAALISLNLIVTGGQGSICLWDIPRGSLIRKVVFSDSEQRAFISHISSVGNSGVVCDHGADLKVVYFPTILEKAE